MLTILAEMGRQCPIDLDKEAIRNEMKPSESHLFLLRGWLEGNEWRWSLLSPSDRQRVGFADLDDLYLYLTALIAQNEQAAKPQSKQPKE